MSTFTVDKTRPRDQQAKCDNPDCGALMPRRWQDMAAHTCKPNTTKENQ